MDTTKGIARKTVRELVEKIADHSTKICELSEESGLEDRGVLKSLHEIRAQNDCIQEILVSFTELFLI